MLKLLSASALALAAVLAATVSSPVSAAPLSNNVSVGHVAPPRPMNNFGANNIGASNQYFTPNGHGPKLKPMVKKWVCGPIVNYDGSPHCHWVTH
jgi:hypothetical protein